MKAKAFSAKDKKAVATRVNALLANQYVLYTKTLNYHWNVEGPFFGILHLLFEKQYEQLAEMIDRTAERVRALEHLSLGTLKEFAEHSTLKEQPGKHPSSTDMLKHLLADHEVIIEQIRTDRTLVSEVNDVATDNFLGDVIEEHEKMAWMLRAHLAK